MLLLRLPHINAAWRKWIEPLGKYNVTRPAALHAKIRYGQINHVSAFAAIDALFDFNGSHRLPSNLAQLLPEFVASHWRQECHGGHPLHPQRQLAQHMTIREIAATNLAAFVVKLIEATSTESVLLQIRIIKAMEATRHHIHSHQLTAIYYRFAEAIFTAKNR